MISIISRLHVGTLPTLLTVLSLSVGAKAQTDNTATGTQALSSNTTGDQNSAFGAKALRFNESGLRNTAVGRGALYSNVAHGDNTAVGNEALYYSTGGSNVAVGSWALLSNTTGGGSVAVGTMALSLNEEGEYNVAVGDIAMPDNFDGNHNTAVGAEALTQNTSGSFNVAIGRNSMPLNITGNNNTAVGYSAGPTLGNLSNTGTFGSQASVSASNTIRIGNSSVTSIGGFAAWTNLSDGRFKTNVNGNVPGLAFISKLRPVTFNWQLDKLNAFQHPEWNGQEPTGGAEGRLAKERKLQTGFIAQEVERAASECGFDFSGVIKPANEASVYELGYAEFVVPLVRAVQEQQQQIVALNEAVTRLTAENGLGSSPALGGGGQWNQHLPTLFAGLVGGVAGTFILGLALKRRRALRPSAALAESIS